MEILGLEWHAWLTVLLTLGMFVTLMKTKLPADMVFLGIMATLVITGCLPAADALSGFSSSTVLIVGALFIVVAGLESTGVLQWVVKNMLGTPSSYAKAIVRLMVPVATLSAFLTNTTVVALFINVVKMWSAKLNMAPSKFLIPLSYAAGMGGVCTLIGTAPNLIISGFYTEASGDKLGLFSTTAVGLLCLAACITTIILLQKLLPSRKSPEEYLMGEMNLSAHYLTVSKDSHLPGCTLEDINIFQETKNCKLIGIVHFDGLVEHIDMMEREEANRIYLLGGDSLIFTGDYKEVAALGKKLGMKNPGMPIEEEKTKGGAFTLMAATIMTGMVLLSAFNVLPLLNCAFIAALLMILTRCCSVDYAKRSIQWEILMVFACSITLGKAIDNTGLAQMLADNVADICEGQALLAFIVLCFAGTFITEFVSNTACAAILAPVAIKIATTMGVSPLPFCIGLMVSVSASFATPIGSPTHLMVYAPGGYRFSDFLRIGLPMNIVIIITNIIATLLIYPL